MIFERKKYLDELIAGRGNGLVKIITGVRRCGKSFLLFDIWHNWLLEHGVTNSHIIEIQLDDFRNRRLRKPDSLLDYINYTIWNNVRANRMNPLKYQDNSDNHLLLFNDPLQRRRYACSLIMILLMTGVAEILHEKEII